MTPEQVEQLLTKQRTETQAEIEKAKIEGKHENWLEVIATPAFATWLEQQPPEVKSLAGSSKGRDAIKLLDSYQVAVKAAAKPAGEAQASKEQRLAAAVTTRPNSAAPTGKTVDQMSPKELWDYERRRKVKKTAAAGGLTY